MRQSLLLILLTFFLLKDNKLRAQSDDKAPSRMFRIFEDDDFLNISGNGTDNSYTNGLRFDFFYTKKEPSRFFIDRWMPKAGKSSLDVFSWSLTQLMVTPNDITTARYQADDYAYAGALYVTHALYSYNPVKKYNFQTELIAGIRGPKSYAKQLQTWVHSVIHYDKPMGWDNQLETYPLFNINFSAEKQLFGVGNFIEVIGGARVNAGSFIDAFSVYPLVRIGKMAPYFNGYFSQYGSYYRKRRKFKTQYYFVVKPENSFVAHNALLHGKRINEDPATTREDETTRTIRHRLFDIQFGAVIAHGNFSISYLQTHSTEYNVGLYHHNWGNISVYYRW
ncbi:MAG: lipid A deacylase LpxR family protein [Bacteroidota bacterium]